MVSVLRRSVESREFPSKNFFSSLLISLESPMIPLIPRLNIVVFALPGSTSKNPSNSAAPQKPVSVFLSLKLSSLPL